MSSSDDDDRPAVSGPTPPEFAKLPKKRMFAVMRRLGIMHAKNDTKAELVNAYLQWHAAQKDHVDPKTEVDAAPLRDDDDRRQLPRTEIKVEIGLRTETNFFVGFSGDISEGGVFVTTVELLPIGTAVNASFSFPGGIKVVAEGEVAWTREGAAFDSELAAGMGIRFTHLTDDAFDAIQEFASIREPIFHDD